MTVITPDQLGCETFKSEYGVQYAYVAGAMVKEIASTSLVIKLGNADLLGFYGTGGVPLSTIEQSIKDIQAALDGGQSGKRFPSP